MNSRVKWWDKIPPCALKKKENKLVQAVLCVCLVMSCLFSRVVSRGSGFLFGDAVSSTIACQQAISRQPKVNQGLLVLAAISQVVQPFVWSLLISWLKECFSHESFFERHALLLFFFVFSFFSIVQDVWIFTSISNGPFCSRADTPDAHVLRTWRAGTDADADVAAILCADAAFGVRSLWRRLCDRGHRDVLF